MLWCRHLEDEDDYVLKKLKNEDFAAPVNEGKYRMHDQIYVSKYYSHLFCKAQHRKD